MKKWKRVILITACILVLVAVAVGILSNVVSMEHEGMGTSKENLRKEKMLIEQGKAEEQRQGNSGAKK